METSGASQLDRHSYGDSWIHRLDPRTKLLATLFFALVVASFPKYTVVPLIVFAIYPMLLLILGNVPIGLILKRLLLVSPFILFVGIFNPVFDKRIIAEVGGLALTGGWVSLTSLILRFLLSVSAALALVATTPFPALCQGLLRLRVPRVLVVQLLFLYRYLFVLVDEGHRMARARELRLADKKRGRSIKTAAVMLGVLFTRTIDRAERIYNAMLLRGFEGEVRTMSQLRWRAGDVLFLAGVVVGAMGVRVLG